MDSSSNSQNWLGFSLSNHQHLNPSDPSHHHLSLFQAYPQGRGSQQEEDARPGATDLSIFSGAPKLEDFLGGSTASAASAPPLVQFSTHESPATLCETEIYDSGLKTIAASFLRGFSSESQNQQQIHHSELAVVQPEPTPKKTVDTFGQRTSIYRGVTRHRWTGRYEAHLWDNSCRREGQSRKGRQVYLGGYDKEDKAARAYDLAALKYWGPTTTTNFPVSNYEKELEDMTNMTRQEFVASLRRKSSGFSRGASIYRGVTRHHQHGRWQARIGRVAGNKDLYLGTFSTQEEAAEAYDIAAIKFRGLNAVTNFDMSRYDIKSIANSNLPIGGMSGKSKNSSDSASDTKSDERDISSASSVTFASSHQPTPPSTTLSFSLPIKQDPSIADYWSVLRYQQNPNVLPSLFQSSTAAASAFESNTNAPPNTAFTMEFSNSNNGTYEGINYVEQQQSSNGGTGQLSNSSICGVPFGTAIGLNRYDSEGNWVGPTTLHAFQSHAKSSLFQTPIFGIE